MSTKDTTIASLLKPLDYTMGQFGKYLLGDRDEHLPTNKGFDDFMGIFYHLNAGAYVEQYDFPNEPGVAKGPSGTERQHTIEQEIIGEGERCD